MIEQFIFCSDHARENRTLTAALNSRRADIDRQLQCLSPASLLSQCVEDAADSVLEQHGGKSDAVGHPVPVSCSVREIQQDMAASAELHAQVGDERYPCWIWQLPLKYTGADDIFGTWPDKYDDGLATFNNAVSFGHPPEMKWQFGDTGLLFVSMFVPRTSGKFSPEATTHPQEMIEEAVAHLERYCAAVNHQIADWERELRADVVAYLLRLKDAATRGRQSRDATNERLRRWRVPEIELAHPVTPGTDQSIEASVAVEGVAALPSALTDTSLVDIVKVTNRWVQAVEKYPAAFLALEEERISDLLVANLNGAFARAEREVFVGKGRSDFYVQSNTLGLDGTAEVFVGEVKYWSGPQGFLMAVGQTLDNLVQRTLTALLVVLVRDRESYSEAVETGGKGMADIDGASFVGDIAERSHYHLPSSTDPRRMVSLVVTFVDLCRTEEHLPKPKAGPRSRRTRRGR